ncbi:alpha/beta-hydrolase [Rhizoctonia solani AG-3 Rhs1AP]|uniref:Alpha/beta-hydrolase n=1 Tax=Rhizoctonia solani AG-3 Rhs1AP TaxID=1086054 RepID=X8JKU1_9AGAM|nr:alpha/beta-hydrolase [Rhizoctonia solani AG-3 Rhs1AP]
MSVVASKALSHRKRHRPQAGTLKPIAPSSPPRLPSMEIEKIRLTLPPKETERPAPNSSSNNADDSLDFDISQSILNQQRFWKSYQDEAIVQDNEFVKDRGGNLDTMLVFAGLYSGILTAFLIDSTALLQQSPADITNALLLNIAQSQWRLETGNVDSSVSPILLPSFERPAAARVLNCLWYVALMLSLAAAMLAMLAKEWLAAYTTYETRDPHIFALKRQQRFSAFRSWGAITFIDWIPILLHISLLLFTLGLIIQMWSIDSVVATTITSVSLAAAVFYLCTVALGAILDFCPYQARVSAYVRSIYAWLERSIRGLNSGPKQPTIPDEQPQQATSPNSTSDEQFQSSNPNLSDRQPEKAVGTRPNSWVKQIERALTTLGVRIIHTFHQETDMWDAAEWFLDNARDQNKVNSAYQWFISSEIPHVDAVAYEKISNMSDDKLLPVIDEGLRMIDKFQSLHKQQAYDLLYCKGANAARYALIIALACGCGQTYLIKREATPRDADKNTLKARQLVETALPALDEFWKQNLPPITTVASTLLVVAEIRIVVWALDALVAQQDPHNKAFPLKRNDRHLSDLISISPYWDSPPEDTSTNRQPSVPKNLLAELRKRAIHGFCRGSLLLYYHFKEQAPMTPACLASLITGLHLLADHARLSKSPVNASRPQVIYVWAKLGTSDNIHSYDRNSFGKREGLLFGLISVLETDTTASPLPDDIKWNSTMLISKVAPRLIEDWRQDWTLTDPIRDWPVWRPAKPIPEPTLDDFIIQLLLELIYFIIQQRGSCHYYAGDLLNISIKTLVSRISEPKGHKKAVAYFSRDPSFLSDWVKAIVRVRVTEPAWYEQAETRILLKTATLQLLVDKKKQTLGGYRSALLFALGSYGDWWQGEVSNATSRLETVLEAMHDVLKAIYNPASFDHVVGFRHPSTRQKCKAQVISTTKSIVLHLGSRPKLEPAAFREFVYAVSFLLELDPALLCGDRGPQERGQEITIYEARRILVSLVEIISRQVPEDLYEHLEEDVYYKLKVVLYKISKETSLVEVVQDVNGILSRMKFGRFDPSASLQDNQSFPDDGQPFQGTGPSTVSEPPSPHQAYFEKYPGRAERIRERTPEKHVTIEFPTIKPRGQGGLRDWRVVQAHLEPKTAPRSVKRKEKIRDPDDMVIVSLADDPPANTWSSQSLSDPSLFRSSVISSAGTSSGALTPPRTPTSPHEPVLIASSSVEAMDALIDSMGMGSTASLDSMPFLTPSYPRSSRFGYPLYQPPLPTPPEGIKLGIVEDAGSMGWKPTRLKGKRTKVWREDVDDTETEADRRTPSLTTAPMRLRSDEEIEADERADVTSPLVPRIRQRSGVSARSVRSGRTISTSSTGSSVHKARAITRSPGMWDMNSVDGETESIDAVLRRERSVVPSIDDIIKMHAPAVVAATKAISQRSATSKPKPTDADDLFAPGHTHTELDSRTSIDSIADEAQRSLQIVHESPRRPRTAHSTPTPRLQHARSFASSAPADTSLSPFTRTPISDGASICSNTSGNTVVRAAGDPTMEMAQYLRSPRLTRLLTLRRPAHAGLTVSLADVGSLTGRPVIVYLGLGCVRYLVALYDEMAEALNLRLICIDRWGLGRTSDVPTDKRGLLEWAGVVEEVADTLGLGRYSVLAHSAGAPYALAGSLKAGERVMGSVHLLAPWVSMAVDGGYKWLKYVPNGLIKTAQAAEWRLQGWMLGKPPTIQYEGIGFDASAPMSPGRMSFSSFSEYDEVDDFDAAEGGGREFETIRGKESDRGKELDRREFATIRGKAPELEDDPEEPESPTTPLPPPPKLKGLRSMSSLKSRSAKSEPGKHTAPTVGLGLGLGIDDPDARTQAWASEFGEGDRREFGQGDRREFGQGDRPRQRRSLSLNARPLRPTLDARSPTTPVPPSPRSPNPNPNPKTVTLASALLQASHAESLKGGTADLLSILERDSKPWGFSYADVRQPVRVWYGDRDDKIGVGSVRWMERVMKSCEVRIVKGAGHSLMTHAEVVVEVLESIAKEWDESRPFV